MKGLAPRCRLILSKIWSLYSWWECSSQYKVRELGSIVCFGYSTHLRIMLHSLNINRLCRPLQQISLEVFSTVWAKINLIQIHLHFHQQNQIDWWLVVNLFRSLLLNILRCRIICGCIIFGSCLSLSWKCCKFPCRLNNDLHESENDLIAEIKESCSKYSLWLIHTWLHYAILQHI